MCGENHPLTRDHLPHRRLIPACAGKTPSPLAEPMMSPAHPRVCGENWSAIIHDERARGTAPRGRATPGAGGVHDAVDRLSPGGAGNTTPRSSRRTASGAHPRVCGENSSSATPSPSSTGSSPRVRGKPIKSGAQAVWGWLIPARAGKTRRARMAGVSPRWLIPACAGKTARPPSARASRRAHPRVCGENKGGPPPLDRRTGSSPRVRGKRREENQ